MKNLYLNPNQLKELLDNSILVSDRGFSSTTFIANGIFFKLNKKLYHNLKYVDNKLVNQIFFDTYKWDKSDFVDIKQVEYLNNIQSFIKLTDFDQGVVYINNQICGVLPTYHGGYSDLSNLIYDDKLTVNNKLEILNNILITLNELECYKVSHLDLYNDYHEGNFNILYKDTNIKLCDLSGKYITYGKRFNPIKMYSEYLQLFDFFYKNLIKKDPSCEDELRLIPKKVYKRINKYI